MIQAAHARGILVIDDIIVNHGDDLIYSADSGYANFLAPPAGYNLRYRSGSLTYAPPFDIYNSTTPRPTILSRTSFTTTASFRTTSRPSM